MASKQVIGEKAVTEAQLEVIDGLEKYLDLTVIASGMMKALCSRFDETEGIDVLRRCVNWELHQWASRRPERRTPSQVVVLYSEPSE